MVPSRRGSTRPRSLASRDGRRTLIIQGRIPQVHTFFRERTTAQLLATAAPHSSPWLPKAACKQPCRRSPRLPAVDFSGWARPACAARLGGVRPPHDPLASWMGRVRVALPGEDWPTATDGAPMLAVAQLNLRELPCPPP
jgi:hypothetical protein